MVSIMSIGAGSVGVSARPALPTTMSTSGNRQRIMSRALRSSPDSVTEARGTVIGMSITIPSSSGRHELASERRDRLVGDERDDDQAEPTPATRAEPRPRGGGRCDRAPARAFPGTACRLPSGARPTTNVTPSTQTRGAGRSSSDDRTGR